MARRRSKTTWGGARRGSGPKPLPPGERRRHAVLVVLNDAERAGVRAAAGEVPVSTWVRETAVRAARRRASKRGGHDGA